MSTNCLGNHFDIHGGGMDLQFPHHENEIAQSEGATGCQFVNYWIHNGFVQVDEEKMSKSLGNFFTVREILNSYQAEEIRYFVLASHYRSPLNYSDDNLDKARGALTRLYTALRGIEPAVNGDAGDFRQRFDNAMSDDFNTPEALAVLFDLARDVNRARDAGSAEAPALAATLRSLSGVLGLLQADPETYLRGQPAPGDKEEGLSDEAIESLIQARLDARAAKDYAAADRIRDQLGAAGIQLDDGPQGTHWRRS